MDAHLTTCLAAGLAMTGCRSESKPGRCSFSIGPLPPLDLADQLLAARWLLTRVADRAGAAAAFDGDDTCSLKLSTRSTRADATGAAALADAVDALVGAHGGLVVAYGCAQPAATCLAGVEPPASASIRIPAAVALHGRGHLEDRRPPGGVDPYFAGASLLCAALRQPLPQCVPHTTAATAVESAACSPALSGAVAAGTPDTPPPRSHGAASCASSAACAAAVGGDVSSALRGVV
jgi:glutamine synthetase